MFLRILLVLLFLAAMIGGLALMKFQQIQGEIAMFSQPMPPSSVSAVEVEAMSWQPRLGAIGNVQAVQGVMVNNQVAGQVERILFESGDMVRAGQALVQLDTEVDEADLAGLVASLDLAETQLKRNQKLLKDRAVSQGDFDEISAQVSQAKAQVQSKQALIEKKTIRAPFDGQLGIRRVNLGQFLAAGSAIAELEALDPVYVDYSLPERHLAKLSEDQPVQISGRPIRTGSSTVASRPSARRWTADPQRADPRPVRESGPPAAPRHVRQGRDAAAAEGQGADAAAPGGHLQHLWRLGVRDRGAGPAEPMRAIRPRPARRRSWSSSAARSTPATCAAIRWRCSTGSARASAWSPPAR
jgi:multidrug efflux pump subunit AcrA (membrane-fusion protein)